MNYRELQNALKSYKEQGLTTIKLSASATELEAEFQRLTVKKEAADREAVEEVAIAPGESSEVMEVAINHYDPSSDHYDPSSDHLAGCKVLTLRQPWATFLAKGIKLHETRSWRTSYRGKILIHAGLRKIDWDEVPELHILEKHYPDIKDWDYPLGTIVAEAELTSCRQTEAARIGINEVNRACGDWSDGRFAWAMENVKPLFIPNVKGQLWLWTYAPMVETPEVMEVAIAPGENSEVMEVAIAKSNTDIPFWLTGKKAAQARALCEKLEFWYIGTVDEWEDPEPIEIIAKTDGWLFNYDQIGMFVEARCNGAIFNIDAETTTPEEDQKLVRKAKKIITQAGKEWGEQFGVQLDIFGELNQARSPPTRECA